MAKYPDEDATILKCEVTTSSSCMLWNCIGIFIITIHTYYIMITSVPITYNCVLIIVIGAIHRYYESRRRAFNNSRPERRALADAAKRKAKRKQFRQNVK